MSDVYTETKYRALTKRATRLPSCQKTNLWADVTRAVGGISGRWVDVARGVGGISGGRVDVTRGHVFHIASGIKLVCEDPLKQESTTHFLVWKLVCGIKNTFPLR